MKIAEGFVLKTIAGNHIVVPVGANSIHFNSVITLNDSGAFLWNLLNEDETEQELVSALLEAYEVDESTAKQDVAKFLESLRSANILQ